MLTHVTRAAFCLNYVCIIGCRTKAHFSTRQEGGRRKGEREREEGESERERERERKREREREREHFCAYAVYFPAKVYQIINSHKADTDTQGRSRVQFNIQLNDQSQVMFHQALHTALRLIPWRSVKRLKGTVKRQFI